MRKQMTHKEFIALVRFLEANKQRLQEERPSYLAVAQQASAELGFVCTVNNVRAAADASDLSWTARRSPLGGRASRKHVTRILARAVMEIADALDIRVDQDICRIARGRRLSDAAESENVGATQEANP